MITISRPSEKGIELDPISIRDLEIDVANQGISLTRSDIIALHLTAVQGKSGSPGPKSRFTRYQAQNTRRRLEYKLRRGNGFPPPLNLPIAPKDRPIPKSPQYIVTELGMGYRFAD